MMYNYIKLADDTQIAHSNILEDQTVQVSIERPVDGGFCSATCFLPSVAGSLSRASTPPNLNTLPRL